MWRDGGVVMWDNGGAGARCDGGSRRLMEAYLTLDVPELSASSAPDEK